MSIMHFCSALPASSGGAIAISGLYDSSTAINSINLGATVKGNRQDAFIQGAEPSNGAFGSAYSEESFTLGDYSFAEFEIIDAIDTANFRIGIQPEGSEQPDQLCGSFTDSFGLLPNGNAQVNGATVLVGGGFSYVNTDIIDVAINYSGNGICGFTFYKNDVLQSVHASLSSMTLDQETKYRIAATIGQNTDTNAEISVFLNSADQTYTPVGDQIPLDDIVRPRNIEWSDSRSAYQSIEGGNLTTSTCKITFNTDGTYDFERSSGATISGTWRLDGLTDTTNFEYKIIYTETTGDGTIAAQGGATIGTVEAGYTDLTSDGLGIQMSVLASGGIVLVEEADVEISIRDKSDAFNRTGTMLVSMRAETDNS